MKALWILSTIAVGTRLGEKLLDAVHGIAHSGVVGMEAAVDTPMGVQDRGVVAPAEGAAYGGQRFVGELAREVHRNLAGERHTRPAVVGVDLRELDSEGFGCRGLDGVHG